MSAFFVVSLDDVRVLLRVRVDDLGPAARQPGDVARDRARQGDPAGRDGARAVRRDPRRRRRWCSTCTSAATRSRWSRWCSRSRSASCCSASRVTAICRTAQQANAFAYVGMVLFGAIGGALVPFSVLPRWAQTVAPVTPTYWAMRGFRSVILDGQGLGGDGRADRRARARCRRCSWSSRCVACASTRPRSAGPDPPIAVRAEGWIRLGCP